MYKLFFKRVFDILIALFALGVLSPIFLFILFVLSPFTSWKPFFLQKRPGLNGEIFLLIKFKTLKELHEANGELANDSKRNFSLGLFLRKTSLDEIPQFINVLLGDMSLIGPRPLLVEYLPLYNEIESRRHEVRPGITGWAQVNGRNNISWKKKFEYDVWYVDNLSFMLDLKIAYMTIIKVFKREGINYSTSVTMEKFKGSE
jgi:lipopolysaccharide/colanic/teichoic acid biosynthesis glycosyltransferase